MQVARLGAGKPQEGAAGSSNVKRPGMIRVVAPVRRAFDEREAATGGRRCHEPWSGKQGESVDLALPSA